MSNILIISAGGTLLKKQSGDHMEWSVDISDLLPKTHDYKWDIIKLYDGLSASFLIEDVINISNTINETSHTKILVATGTDALEEIAYALSLLVDKSKSVIITGAMKPFGRDGYDGRSNLTDAINYLTQHQLAGDVSVLFDGRVISAARVYKQHSTALNAFQSWPAEKTFLSGDKDLSHKSSQIIISGINFDASIAEKLNVPIMYCHTNTNISTYNFAACDGIIIAGMGAGSVPQNITDYIAKNTVSKIPVIVSTRCVNGPNHADHIYTGSLKKYESRGFIVNAFNGLSALQARVRLHLELTSLLMSQTKNRELLKTWKAKTYG